MEFLQNLQKFRVRVIPQVWFCTYPAEHNVFTHKSSWYRYGSLTKLAESSGYGYGSLAELTEVPGTYVNVVPVPVPAPGYFKRACPYLGYCTTGVQKLKLPHFHVSDTCRVSILPTLPFCNNSSRCCYRAREHVDPNLRQKFRVRGTGTNVVQNLQNFWYDGYTPENTPGMVLDVPYRTQPWKKVSAVTCTNDLTPRTDHRFPL